MDAQTANKQIWHESWDQDEPQGVHIVYMYVFGAVYWNLVTPNRMVSFKWPLT